MSDRRKHRLVDCNPRWVEEHREADDHGKIHYLMFDCPEGHEDCRHNIPFSPRLDGEPYADTQQATWQRTGDTFETLTLTPSILRIQRYPSREAAIAAGCIPEYVTETFTCALHIFIKNGAIEFCGDSK